MKVTLRLIISLLLIATLVASGFSWFQYVSERTRYHVELEQRAYLVAESFEGSVRELFRSNSKRKRESFVEKFENRERLAGIILIDSNGVVLASSKDLHPEIDSFRSQVTETIAGKRSVSNFQSLGSRQVHIQSIPVFEEDRFLGVFLLVHNASYIDSRLAEIWQRNFVRLLIQSLFIILTTVLVVRWSITGPIARIADWLKGFRLGSGDPAIQLPRGDILGPLALEVTRLAKNLAAARAAAAEEARLRVTAESVWTSERLKEHIKSELNGKNLFIVSNREPYMHVRQGKKVETIVPAGGLVTALDPILRACGGVWIAHGSGDADRQLADEKGKLGVPPDEPLYTLRRVWLSKEEEEGYYYGFSNEGIWPLCHITHTRPLFRLEDWETDQRVNEKFAGNCLEEIETEESPVVLVQDYHLSLLPFLIKSRRPDARVGIFWHIPWPNPEVFGICPWKKEILLGLLGADLVGFHTQFHCNNFLETVDRVLESKIDWDQFSVQRQGQTTLVRPFPISVAFPRLQEDKTGVPSSHLSARESVLKELNLHSDRLGVGVDRIDYTKGILERFWAVERFFVKYPEFIGRFTFIELGAPSRTHIKRYHDLVAEVEETADRINWKYQTKDWKPIVFLKSHHDHETINRYYLAADLCLVTSLHDGMNLVAKEFIASRDDEEGVLILSQFAGASRELSDALLVNPYDIEEMTDLIHQALTLPAGETSERMKRLREVIKERNVYRWAANLVTALARLRIPKVPEEPEWKAG